MHRVVVELGRLHVLTADQVCRRFLSPGSKTYAQAIMKTLASTGYAVRGTMPKTAADGMNPNGRAPSVYYLGTKGLRLLQREGRDLYTRTRRDEPPTSELFLRHTLALNDVCIAAELLAEHTEGIELISLRHERELKRAPIVATVNGERIVVIPDGELVFQVKAKNETVTYEDRILLEVDRGTEEQKHFRRKVRGLVAAYGAEPVQIAVICVPDKNAQRRAADIKHWIELELADTRHLANLFAITWHHPVDSPPYPYFFAPHFQRPFSDQSVALIETTHE